MSHSDAIDASTRLASVETFALNIYQHDFSAREFLNRPHAMLMSETPRDVALSSGAGAKVVINLLGRTAFGGAV